MYLWICLGCVFVELCMRGVVDLWMCIFVELCNCGVVLVLNC